MNWGRYCPIHRNTLSLYGHPLAKLVRLSWLLPYAVQAQRLLEANKDDHDGIRIAIDELQALLDASIALGGDKPQRHPFTQQPDKSDRRAMEHYARLAKGDVTPLNILAMVAAVALFDQDNPSFLLNSRVYHFAVAGAVRRLVKIKGDNLPFGARVKERIGRHLAETYAPLTAVVLQAIRAQDERVAGRRSAFSTPLPFHLTTTPTTKKEQTPHE